MTGSTLSKEEPMNSDRAALVQTLRDILSAFRPALSRLPADVDVHQAQRLVTTLDGTLEKIEEKQK